MVLSISIAKRYLFTCNKQDIRGKYPFTKSTRSTLIPKQQVAKSNVNFFAVSYLNYVKKIYHYFTITFAHSDMKAVYKRIFSSHSIKLILVACQA